MYRNNRLRSLLFALLMLLVAVSGNHAGCNTGAQPDQLTLTWSGDTTTTMTVSWRTANSVANGLVQYEAGTALTANAFETRATRALFTTELGAKHLFRASLSALQPGTRYTYRVGDGKQWSDPRTFSTAELNTTEFSFLVFGDSQSIATGKQPYSQWRDTVQSAYRAHPDAKFMLLVGDLVDTGQSGAHWQAWFAAAAGVIDTIPVMPVTGNHECYSSSGIATPTYWNALFPMPQNGPDGMKNQVYAFDYGSLHLVALDSQQGEQRKARGDILTPQQQWLESDLAASVAPWKLAFFHKPPYDLQGGTANAEIRKAFSPILEQHGVQLVLNGHDHGVARTFALREGIRVPRGGDGTVYFTAGRSGIKTYKGLKAHPQHEYFYNPLDMPNYLLVQVTPTALTVSTFKQNGTLVDTRVIKRSLPPPPDLKPTIPDYVYRMPLLLRRVLLAAMERMQGVVASGIR